MITEEMLDRLRQEIGRELSPHRFAHTVSVEQECTRLADILLPEKTAELRAAALLHDLTKELSRDEQLLICRDYGIRASDEAMESAAVLHGMTAAAILPKRFPDLATDEICRAIAKHTVGAAEMTVFDKILFLADYIEPTRRYDACLSLRKHFYEELDARGATDAVGVLDRAVMTAVCQTLTHLIQKRMTIAPESLTLYNALSKRKDFLG